MMMFLISACWVFAQEARVAPNTCIKVESGTRLNISGGNLVLESDALGDVSLIDFGSVTYSGGGETQVERYVVAWTDNLHGWHFLSTPVAAQNIQTGFVPSPPTPDGDFYKWYEATGLWINTKLENGSWNTEFESTFTVGEGYLVAYSTEQTKTFAGVLNNADVAKTGLTYTVASSNTGWHLLGNPYPCALQWNHTSGASGWNLSNIDGTAKIWNEANASYTDITSGGIIPAMQGFMVHVSSEGTGSLKIFAEDRTYSGTTWYKNDTLNIIKLTAYDTEGSTAQECVIKFNPDATSGFDTQYDSRFLAGYAPLFYAVSGDINLSVNTLPQVAGELEIPLNFTKNVSSAFYIEAEGINKLAPQADVYLLDLKLNYTQKLNENPVYHFSATKGDNSARFKLHFGPVGIAELPAHNIRVFPANGNIEIHFVEPTVANIAVYNITGQLLKATGTGNSKTCIISMPSVTGVFVVNISTSEYFVSEKVIFY